MGSPFVDCPHCRNQILIDDGDVGTVVSCPICRGQFWAPNPQSQNTYAPDPTSMRRMNIMPRKQGSPRTLIALGGVVVAMLLGAFFVFQSQSVKRDNNKNVARSSPPREPAKDANKSSPAPQPKSPSNGNPDPIKRPPTAATNPRAVDPVTRPAVVPDPVEEQRIKETQQREKKSQEKEEKRGQMREQLLADVATRKARKLEELSSVLKDKQKTFQEAKDKIVALNRKYGVRQQKVDGVTVVDRGVGKDLRKYDADMEIVDKEVGAAQNSVASAEERLEAAEGQFSREERRIKFEHPLKGEPKLVGYRGMFYDERELALVKQYLSDHETPQAAADDYVRELLASGVIEAANSLNRVDPDYLNFGIGVWYRVKYVSVGGIVNVREARAFVTSIDLTESKLPKKDIFLPNCKLWYVTPETRLTVLVGLPFP
jgi:hypothetical protein